MFRLLSKMSDDVWFWRICFLLMTICFAWAYNTPRIVVRDRHMFLIMDHDIQGNPTITKSRAI